MNEIIGVESRSNIEETNESVGPPVDENGWTFLHAGAITENVTQIKAFMQYWPEHVDQRDNYGSTALHLSARWNSVSTLELFIKEGQADVNAINNIGWTPLHCAAWEGNLDNVKLLVTPNNKTINTQSKNGWTPLHFASRWGYKEITETLLDAGNARIDIEDEDGQTPVHQAAFMGRIEILQLLNSRGLLNFYKESTSGNTIIDSARTNKKTLKYFINMDDKYGMTFLQHVAIQGRRNILLKLLDYHNKKRNKNIFPKNDFNSMYTIKGRNNDLKYIKQILQQDKILVVAGISGMGKSALVKSYAWKNKTYYEGNLFFVDCQNEEIMKYSFIKIAKHLKITTKKYDIERDFKAVVKDIFIKLKSTIGLIVFDNVNTREKVQNYLQNDLNVDVIIISLVNNIWDDIKCLNLLPIHQTAALEIFNPLFEDSLLAETQRENIKILTVILQGVPLALHIAKMYIIHKTYKNNLLDLGDYLNEIKIIIGKLNSAELIENEYEKFIYSVIIFNLNEHIATDAKLHLIKLNMLISFSFLNPSFLSVYFLNVYNSELEIFIRDLVVYITNNEVVMNKYATKLALFHTRDTPKIKTDCFKTVLKLLLQDKTVLGEEAKYNMENYFDVYFVSENDELHRHHKTFFSFANEFRPTIQKYIFDYLLRNKYFMNPKKSSILGKLLQYLAKYGCTENISDLFDVLDKNVIDKHIKKFKLLHAAVESGNIKTVELIYQYDNNIKKINDMGHTMAWVAIEANHTEVLEFLISKGASLEAIDRLNKSPLHRAAFLGRIEIVKLLLEKGVDPNIRNKFQRTPLHYAAMEGHNDVIIELLLHKDIDINARDHYRRSPIFETVRCFQLECLKLFIEHGAKVITKDNLDMSPYRLAKRQRKRLEILEVFKDFEYTDETVVETVCNIRIC